MKKLVKNLLVASAMIVATLNMVGCSSKIKNLESSQASELSSSDLSTVNIVINNPTPGRAPNGHTYDKSGIYLSNCIKDMVVVLNRNTRLSNKVLPFNDMVKYVSEKNNAKYLIYATILNWEDHPTEWTGVPDRISIKKYLKELF